MDGCMETIGLIAGNGCFPVIFARTARSEGVSVVAVAHEGETDPDLAREVDGLTWIKVGQLEPVIEAFRACGVRRAVMAGGIRKSALMEHFAPDARGMRCLARISTWSDDAVLRSVASELEDEGIEMVESTLFLRSILAPEGVLAGQELDEGRLRDVRYGVSVAKGIGRFDVGQTVVVKSGVVLAIEAIEGTDSAIRRGGALGRGGCVVVKMSKPGQDLRFDVPAVGPETVAVCAESGVSVLAVEAGRTLLLQREKLLADAASAGLTVVGVRPDDAGAPA